MTPRTRRARRIDVRDQRIPGGRFTASARTASAPEARRREAAVRALIDAGEFEILGRITSGVPRLHIADVQRAVEAGDVDRLRLSRTSPLLVGATVDRLLQRKAATRSAGTLKQVQIGLRQLEAALGVFRGPDGAILWDVDLVSVDTRRCEDWLHGPRVAGKPWAARTQAVRHAYALQVWDLAIEEEKEAAERENRKPRLTRNPWRQVEPAPIHPTRVIFLTADERDRMLDLLAASERRYLVAFMAAAYHGGLRLSEARYLRTGVDVDLDAGVLRIQARPGQWAWKPKTTRGTREVPINADLRAYLEEHQRLGFAGDRYFFHGPRKDSPLHTDRAHQWWVWAYEAAGIKWGRSDVDSVVYHTGRHSFASLLVQQGESPLIVAELMGDTYQEVIKSYGHLTPRDRLATVKKLESGRISAISSTAKPLGSENTSTGAEA